MKIVSASLPARDPAALQRWYAEHVGVTESLFVDGEASIHHVAFHVTEPSAPDLELSDEYDFSNWDGAHARYFHDPEGNIGELIARPEPLPELSIAEVGLPVDDVAAAVEALAAIGIPRYRPGTEAFAPLGDREGLLILVRVGRNWFPTDAPSGPAPLEVTVSGAVPGEVRIGGHRVVSI